MQLIATFWNRLSERALRGMLAGILLFASLNALSYFARSEGTKLLGGTRDGGAIGFPWLVWQGDARGAGDFRALALFLNVVVGLAASAVLGVVIAWAMRRGESHYRSQPLTDSSVGRVSRRITGQFTLRGMLLSVACLAVLLSLGQRADERTKLHMLLAVYWLGPCVIAAGFALARRISPDAARFTAILIAALAAIAALILASGSGIHDMTQAALGLFVYWTPQCLLLAAALLLCSTRRAGCPPAKVDLRDSPLTPDA